MKKILLRIALLRLICMVFIFLVFLYFYYFPRGFNIHRNLGENESIYKGELVFAGKGPEITFEPTISEDTLVLKGSFEDHSDHLFLDYNLFFENYPMKRPELFYLPGNVVKFKGVVEAIDGAAGNHYYNIKSIDKLELVRYPDAGEVKKIFDGYNYCDSDSDCGYFMGECPLGCYIPLNIEYVDTAHLIVSNFINHLGDERCIYDCIAMDKVVCKNYKCEMINSESEEINESVTCTTEEKAVENCNMIYQPVCGSDSKTYGNSCVACQSETVESYITGECESSAFTIEGDSEYLQEVEEILTKNGAVTCDLFYTEYDRQIHSFFMADKDRFYSAVDDYSDNLQRNVFYTLAVDGKIYNWSTFSDSEKIAIDSPVDIEGEIANLLMDLCQYQDFKMDCYEGIDVNNEHLFESLSE